MAIISALPGLRVEVMNSGVFLEEHDDHEPTRDDRTLVRYVEAVSGQVFAISMEIDPGFEFEGDCVGFEIHVDGKRVDACIMRRDDIAQSNLSQGRLNGDGEMERYHFAELRTVADNSTTGANTSAVKQLGTIAVYCNHENIVEDDDEEDFEIVEEETGEQGPISERALKGRDVSHTVHFTEAEQTMEKEYTLTYPVGENIPAATLIFCYRSLHALKSLGLVPRTPSPPPPPALEDRPIKDLTEEDIRQMQERLRAVNADLVRVKREHDNENDDSPRARQCSRTLGPTSTAETESVADITVTPVPTRDIEVIVLD